MARLTRAQISAKITGEVKDPIKENMEKMEKMLDTAAKMNMLDAMLSKKNVQELLNSGKIDKDNRKIADAATLMLRAEEQEKFNYEFIINKPEKDALSTARITAFRLNNKNSLAASDALAIESKNFPKDKEIFGLREFSDANAVGEGNGYLLKPHAYVDTSINLSDKELKKKVRKLVSTLSIPDAIHKLTKEVTGNRTISQKVVQSVQIDGAYIGNDILEQNFNRYHTRQLAKSGKSNAIFEPEINR